MASEYVGKTLELKSPMGEKSMVYKWPLKKGKGSVRRSEDKEDEAAEILETIRFVKSDFPDIEEFLDKNKSLNKYDPTSFESMESLCLDYNTAVEKYQTFKKKGTANVNRDFSERCSRSLLQHILNKCYNKSVTDPNLLNHYEAFTPEVYGETSFGLICQILDKLHPISKENKFVDLGSGVGQVVLQVAALTDCEISFGIEKANTPAKYAEELERWFKFWMAFYGKKYSPFRLVHGDFLEQQFRSDILQSSIVFVNNFAFGPEVDQHLKDIFADLNDGARIFSSKSFCALNFRITDRNLSDIGTIMHVSKMDPLKGSVSWTGRPVSYYLHVIDRARLERYFQKTKSFEENHRRRRGIRGNGDIDDSSMEVSKDNSRASSVENDLTTDSKAWTEDDFDLDEEIKPKRRGRKAGTKNGQSSLQTGSNVKRTGSGTTSGQPVINKTNTRTNNNPTVDENSMDATNIDSNSSSPPPSSENSRPLRSSTENSQERKMPNKRGPPFGNRKKKTNAQIASGIAGLDLLHETTLDCIEASNKDVTAPTGCVNERLNKNNVGGLVHEELSSSLMQGEDGKPIPFQLQVHLDKIKRQYLTFIRQMQDPKFKEKAIQEIEHEQKVKSELTKREKQLKSQIDNLIQDSLSLLKSRLGELGISAKSPSEFIEKAKGIVSQHHEFQRNKATIETEVRQLEIEQEKIIQTKEKEMIEHLLKQGMTMPDARRRVKQTIENTITALQGAESHKVSPLLNKLADVTLTKCEQLPSSTQIRKRPVVAKQKDWPEKKIKDDNFDIAKIDEKNPEVLAKKIIAQGRNLEKSKGSAMLLSPRSKDPLLPRSSVEVEVRRIEQPIQQPQPQQPQQQPPQSVSAGPRLVDLPRVDLTSSLAASANVQPKAINLPIPPQDNQNELVLPPHPGSRSSDHTEEIAPYHANKMSSTPRAEQFEDRLKTIIHNVLSGDDSNKDQKFQALNIQASGSKLGQPNNKPMFSPVKKELPSHLPMPPSGITDRSAPTAYMRTTSDKMRPSQQPPSSHRLPTMNSAITMNEIIEKEIEKSLVEPQHRRPPGPPMSPQRLVRHNSIPQPQQAASMRMNQVIEDSLRSHERAAQNQPPPPPPRQSDLVEGLACPRTKSPNPPGAMMASRSLHPSSTSGFPGRGGDDFHEYPAMEGLGARFSSIMEKRHAASVGGPPPEGMIDRAFAHQPPPQPAHPNNRFPGQYPGQFPGGQPPQQTPPMPGSNYGLPPRKRASPSSMPVLPPKKQHMDMAEDFRFQKDDDSGKRWQDEINSGFDRLVAYATEVDKRRRSTDSNSPVRQNSDLSSDDFTNNQGKVKTEIKDDVFDQNRPQQPPNMMSMKYKSNASVNYSGPRGVVSANSPYARAMPTHTSKTSHVPSALASVGVANLDDLQSSASRSPLPGENLPEHHFKKRYFAESNRSVTPNSNSNSKNRSNGSPTNSTSSPNRE